MAALLGMGRDDPRTTAGMLMRGSSLKGAMVSSVMYRVGAEREAVAVTRERIAVCRSVLVAKWEGSAAKRTVVSLSEIVGAT
jgi:hypothetical protein